MKTVSNHFRALGVLFMISILSVNVKAENRSVEKNKILFVLSSHGQLGDSDKKTGYYLSEVSHAWEVLTRAGFEIDFVSPKGGEPPVDGFDLEDPINRKFWDDAVYRNKLQHTLTPTEVNPADYKAIYYAGGHGTMWDFADNESIAALASAIYESNGLVAAVCHGPAGLLPIKLKNGMALIAGKAVNGFSNEEEVLRGLDKTVPFSLENSLKELGGIYQKGAPWKPFVVVDQRVITGQNPASARGVAEAMLVEFRK